MASARRAAWIVFLVAAIVVAADLWTKSLARAHLEGQAPVDLIPGVLRLSFTTNTGGAFGLSTSTPWFFGAASLLIAIGIVWYAWRVHSTTRAVGLGLVLGGAVGNLVERLSGGIGMSGKVVDFIDLRVWPVFNLADASVVVGAVILVWSIAKDRDEPAQ